MKKLTMILFMVFFCVMGSFAKDGKMTVTIDGKDYSVKIDRSVTSDAILEKLPLDFSASNFGNHEFWGELPFKPEFAQKQTSKIKAGHVYYWDGWNAFVINYIDWDITPYRVVHIGEIEDKSICDVLAKKKGEVKIYVH